MNKVHSDLKPEDLFEAYKKLKAYVYYDSSELFLRDKISQFEHYLLDENIDIEIFLNKIFKELVKFDISNSEYFRELVEKISYTVMPKAYSYENKSDIGSDNFVTNNKSQDDFYLEKINLFFDGPIELYIVSVLWCMKIGYKLDQQLDNCCYGNRLVLTNTPVNEGKRVVRGFPLFKPYYKQYQKWRDDGIEIAREMVKKKDDVLLINLDIKNYFYTSNINLQTLNKISLESENSYITRNLQYVFTEIHKRFTEIISKTNYPIDYTTCLKENEFVIPIGLPSSNILANWFLIDFDKRIRHLINPAYYSRYVDDIFLVVANPKINWEDNCDRTSFNYAHLDRNVSINELSKVDRTLLEFLYPLVKVVNNSDTPFKKEKGVSFKLECYENLYFQGDKSLLYYFEHTSSLAVLDKFKEELEKRSSEFRFLPSEELDKKTFDEEAFELVFDGTLGKIRTLKDYRENRFGVSVYFAKRIYSALRQENKLNVSETDKILRFFRGKISAEYYRVWEKIFTYFIVTKSCEGFIQFYERTLKEIINVVSKVKSHEIENVSVYIISDSIINYFSLSAQISLALEPNFYESIKKEITKINETANGIFRDLQFNKLISVEPFTTFRTSNLIRHSFVFHPLINYTTLGLKSESLIKKALPENILSFKSDERLNKLSPRKIKFWEAAWYVIYKKMFDNQYVGDSNQSRIELDIFYKNDNITSHQVSYIDEAFDLYFEINYWYLSQIEKDNQREVIKKKFLNIQEIPHCVNHTQGLEVHEIYFPNSGEYNPKLKIGLANLEVKENHYESSMLGKPILDQRYEYFAGVLNKLESEDCELFVMPELGVPYSLIPMHLEFSARKQKALVTGIEHWTSNAISYNFILTVLPVCVEGENDTIPIIRLKNHYAPIEETWINGYRNVVPKPKPYRYHLFRWRGYYFSSYYCFELGDILHRTIFKSKVDFLISSIWNLDVNYYASIADCTTRDIHCFYIQVNTRQFGDSRVTVPKQSGLKDQVKIRGGINDVIITTELEIQKLREFQFKNFELQKDDKYFKPTPADFEHHAVKIRMRNNSFSNPDA